VGKDYFSLLLLFLNWDRCRVDSVSYQKSS